MIYESGRYRDPLYQLERKEERLHRGCIGCIHSKILLDKAYCEKDRKHGKKCSTFKENA